jgi:hypothetical protein
MDTVSRPLRWRSVAASVGQPSGSADVRPGRQAHNTSRTRGGARDQAEPSDTQTGAVTTGLRFLGMSLPVDLDALRDRVAEYGSGAFLITVNEDGTSHVVSVTLRHEGEQLMASGGRRTRTNLERNPASRCCGPRDAIPPTA